MEGLAPTLQLCLEVRLSIERGVGLLEALRQFTNRLDVETRSEITQFLMTYEQSGRADVRSLDIKSPYRRALFDIFSAGLGGEPILVCMKEVEIEIRQACEEEIEKYIASLPLKVMLPLLLVQFPAFLLLMFGPILREFTRSFI